MLRFARPGHHPWREEIGEEGTMAGLSVPSPFTLFLIPGLLNHSYL